MRIYVALKDVQRVTAKFERLPTKVQASLLKRAERLRVLLRQYIITKKLSGQVLDRKTGRLQRNTRVSVESTRTSIKITAGNISKYARIHEKGGVIRAHVIEPKKAMALSWTTKGVTYFAKKVEMPSVRMPRRSYLASATSEMSKRISLELKAAIVEGAMK